MNRSHRKQRGVVLLIALTVLVAMSLAGVALMRSVDNTVVIAGNVSFKQASLMVAERGTNDAWVWLNQQATAVPPTLQDDNNGVGYYSSRPPSEPDWFDDNTWASAVTTNGGLPDSTGNTVQYLIHRMCQQPGLQWNEGNQSCVLYFPPADKLDSGSKTIGTAVYQGTAQLYYRVTSRVLGPRNNVTITQTSIVQ
ncbi:MAG TPA: hypothetical protein VLT89_10965 [Usitatibacter sp.]|nr:hypothetical protein [Usitatibacter sp.]